MNQAMAGGEAQGEAAGISRLTENRCTGSNDHRRKTPGIKGLTEHVTGLRKIFSSVTSGESFNPAVSMPFFV